MLRATRGNSVVIFDSHAHLVSDDPARYPPAPLGGRLDPGALDDPVTAERLLCLMDKHGVERAALVQRAHIYGYDNSYVVDSANAHPDRFVAVICVDAQDHKAPEHVRHWVAARGARGIRLVAPGLTSPSAPTPDLGTGWFAGPDALAVWEVAAELGVSICIHFFRWNRAQGLADLATVARRFVRVPVIVDHVSNLLAESGPPHHGVDAPLRALADHPNVFLKLSTINLGRLAAQNLPAAPVVGRVVNTFGAEHVMWGSDIAQSTGTYGGMIGLARDAITPLEPRGRSSILHDTAAAIYS